MNAATTRRRSGSICCAGQAAQANYANTAAISYYRRVLPLLPVRERR
jgi:hypothetical protein